MSEMVPGFPEFDPEKYNLNGHELINKIADHFELYAGGLGDEPVEVVRTDQFGFGTWTANPIPGDGHDVVLRIQAPTEQMFQEPLKAREIVYQYQLEDVPGLEGVVKQRNEIDIAIRDNDSEEDEGEIRDINEATLPDIGWLNVLNQSLAKRDREEDK